MSKQAQKPKNRTGDKITTSKRQAIINGLAKGEPIESIAKATHSSNHTVMAIREVEAQEVARRKEMLIASFGRLAANGVNRLNEEMEAGTLKGSLLMTTTGMAVDKLTLLTNDPQRIELNVTGSIQHNLGLIERMDQLAQSINAKALPVPRGLQAPAVTPSREAQRQDHIDAVYESVATTPLLSDLVEKGLIAEEK